MSDRKWIGGWHSGFCCDGNHARCARFYNGPVGRDDIECKCSCHSRRRSA